MQSSPIAAAAPTAPSSSLTAIAAPKADAPAASPCWSSLSFLGHAQPPLVEPYYCPTQQGFLAFIIAATQAATPYSIPTFPHVSPHIYCSPSHFHSRPLPLPLSMSCSRAIEGCIPSIITATVAMAVAVSTTSS
ncbi:hypothetical protein BHM03_00032230 [Ensete ventricosum]|nr:hypothetical protein BHM03_00032230 [Ensete ventricosum]